MTGFKAVLSDANKLQSSVSKPAHQNVILLLHLFLGLQLEGYNITAAEVNTVTVWRKACHKETADLKVC